jgi:hypothetical protein
MYATTLFILCVLFRVSKLWGWHDSTVVACFLVTLCWLIGKYQCFGGTYWLYLHGGICSFETLVLTSPRGFTTQKTTPTSYYFHRDFKHVENTQSVKWFGGLYMDRYGRTNMTSLLCVNPMQWVQRDARETLLFETVTGLYRGLVVPVSYCRQVETQQTREKGLITSGGTDPHPPPCSPCPPAPVSR